MEGLSKPCLTFVGDLRDGADAILEMHGAAGNIIAAAHAGSYVVVNIGSGVALNIRYQFTRPNHAPDVRYIPHLANSAKASLIEPVALTTRSIGSCSTTRALAGEDTERQLT